MMRREYLERLKNGKYGQRLLAWSDLHLQPETRNRTLNNSDRQQLQQVMLDEDEEGVQHHALMTLVGFSCQCPAADGVESAAEPGEQADTVGLSLDQWMWSDFHKPSAIFEVSDSDFASRDVHASHHLARRLAYHEFPVTEFKLVDRDTNGWNQLLLDGPHASICLLGRLGLYQKDAVKRLARKDMRFDFPTQYRPPGLRTGKLHQRFHRIREKPRGSSGKAKYHYTKEQDGVRTDYGLVQRYRVFNGSHWITVLLCAGGSYLGTWGAAQWVARDINLPQDPVTGAPIQAPQEVTATSRLEALVRITADTRQRTWDLSNIELLHLSIDDLVWSPDDLAWHSDALVVIRLVLKNGKPDELWLNGRRMVFRPMHNQTFRLAGWVLLDAARRKGPVPFEVLAKNKEIWGGRTVTPLDAKRRVNSLNARHLQDVLSLENGVAVNAEIMLEGA